MFIVSSTFAVEYYGIALRLSSSRVLAKGLKNLLTGGLKPALHQDSSRCTGNKVRA